MPEDEHSICRKNQIYEAELDDACYSYKNSSLMLSQFSPEFRVYLLKVIEEALEQLHA